MPHTSFADLAPGLVCVLQQVVCAPCLLLRLNVISDCVEVAKCPRIGELSPLDCPCHSWCRYSGLLLRPRDGLAAARYLTDQHARRNQQRTGAGPTGLQASRECGFAPERRWQCPRPPRARCQPVGRGLPCSCLAASNPLPESPCAGVLAGSVRRSLASARSAPWRFGPAYVVAGTAG